MALHYLWPQLPRERVPDELRLLVSYQRDHADRSGGQMGVFDDSPNLINDEAGFRPVLFPLPISVADKDVDQGRVQAFGCPRKPERSNLVVVELSL